MRYRRHRVVPVSRRNPTRAPMTAPEPLRDTIERLEAGGEAGCKNYAFLKVVLSFAWSGNVSEFATYDLFTKMSKNVDCEFLFYSKFPVKNIAHLPSRVQM